MKFIVSLSSLALFSLSSISPCLAVNQAISRSSESSLASQPIRSQSEPIKVAGLFDSVVNAVRQGVDMINDERDRRDRAEAAKKAEQDRQAQEAAMQRQQQEQEAARTAAAEQQQLEADRQRQAFENLSPAQKKAYMARQRAEEDTLLTLFGTIFMGGGSSASPSQSDQSDLVQDELRRERENRLNNPPEPEPAPASVEPIDPYYGNSHGGSFYGN